MPQCTPLSPPPGSTSGCAPTAGVGSSPRCVSLIKGRCQPGIPLATEPGLSLGPPGGGGRREGASAFCSPRLWGDPSLQPPLVEEQEGLAHGFSRRSFLGVGVPALGFGCPAPLAVGSRQTPLPQSSPWSFLIRIQPFESDAGGAVSGPGHQAWHLGHEIKQHSCCREGPGTPHSRLLSSPHFPYSSGVCPPQFP